MVLSYGLSAVVIGVDPHAVGLVKSHVYDPQFE